MCVRERERKRESVIYHVAVCFRFTIHYIVYYFEIGSNWCDSRQRIFQMWIPMFVCVCVCVCVCACVCVFWFSFSFEIAFYSEIFSWVWSWVLCLQDLVFLDLDKISKKFSNTSKKWSSELTFCPTSVVRVIFSTHGSKVHCCSFFWTQSVHVCLSVKKSVLNIY